MSTVIGQLEIELYANVARLQQDMAEAKRGTAEAMTEIQRITQGASKAMDEFKAIAGSLGLAMGIGTFASFINGAVESAASLQDLHEKTGVSVEALSALKSVAKLSGTSMDEVAGGMQKLAKNMVAAQDGTGEAAKGFKTLGVSIVDQNGHLRDADAVLMDVAKANAEMGGGAAKTAAIMQVLGKSGANLSPVLNDLAERGNMVGKVTAEQARAADEFQKEMIKMGGAVRGTATAIVLDLLPAIRASADLIKPALEISAAWLAYYRGVPLVIGAASAAFDAYAVSVYAGITATEAFKASLLSSLAATKAAIASFGLVNTAVAGLFAAFAGWQIGTWLNDNFLMARIAANTFVESTMVGWEHIKYGAEVAWEGIKAAFGSVVSTVGGGFASLLERIASGMAAVPGFGAAASSINAMAASLRSASASGGGYAATLAGLSDEHTKAVAGVRAIIADMNVAAVQHFQTAQAVVGHTKATQTNGGAAAAAADEYTKLIAKLREQAAVTDAQLGQDDKLTAGQKEAMAIMVRLRDGTLKLTQAQATQVAGTLEQILTTERHVSLQEDERRLQADLVKDREAALAAMSKETASLEEAVTKQREANATYGMSATELDRYTAAQLRTEAETKTLTAATSDQSEELLRQARALRERAQLLEDGVVLKEAKAAADEWKKTTEQIQNGLTDSLMRAFESGKGFADAFKDTLVNAFKTMVLRPVLSPIVGSMSAGLGGLFGMDSAAASVAGSAGSSLGALSGLGGLSTLMGSMGQFASTGFMSVLTGGGLTTTLGAAGSLMSGGAIGSGLAMGLGALGPLAIGAYALSQLLGSSDNPYAGALTKSWGSDSAYSPKVYTAEEAGWRSGSVSTEMAKTMTTLGSGVTDTLNALSAAFGGQANYSTLAGFGSNEGDGASRGYFQIYQGLQNAAGWEGRRQYSSDASTGLEQYTADVAAQVRSAMDDVAMPSWAKGLVSDLASDATLQDLSAVAATIASTAASLDTMTGSLGSLGGVFGRIGGLSSDAQYQLAQFAGGIDQLVAKSQSFVQTYYSDAEQQGLQAQDLLAQFKALGIDAAGVQSNADFRKLVEGQDLGTETGRMQLAALLDMADEFASVQSYLATQGGTLVQLASSAPQGAVFASLTAAQERQATLAQQQADLQARQAAAAESTAASIVSLGSLLGSKLDDLQTTLADGLQAQRSDWAAWMAS